MEKEVKNRKKSYYKKSNKHGNSDLKKEKKVTKTNNIKKKTKPVDNIEKTKLPKKHETEKKVTKDTPNIENVKEKDSLIVSFSTEKKEQETKKEPVMVEKIKPEYRIKPTWHEIKIKRKANRKNKAMLVFMLIITTIVIAIAAFSYVMCINLKDTVHKAMLKKQEETKQNIIDSISMHYNEFVETVDEVSLYALVDDEYVETMKISSNTKLNLGDIDINVNTKYFPVNNYGETYYVEFANVSPIETETIKKNDRYKRYIPFNQNVITDNTTTLYKSESEYIILLSGINAPVYKIDGNKYYVPYNDELYYVLKEEVTNIVENVNTYESNATGISTVLYHFLYDPNKIECGQIICQTLDQVQQEIDYLKSNNYLTVKMSEFEDWIDGKIRLPEKSIVLTLDDGMYADVAKELFTRNEVDVTFFIVSAWFDPKTFESDYVEVHSHTDNLHRTGLCPTGQGGGIQCLPEQELLDDLQLSRSKTNNTTVMSYPFFEYNNYSIQVVKKAGFTMAFAGLYAGGHYQMVVGGDKYQIPRYTILSTTTLQDFINVL